MDMDDCTLIPQADGSAIIEMTVGEETMEHLRRLRELYADEVPDGDLGKIFGMALHALVLELREQQAAVRRLGH
jgi:hypothetical protein